MVEVYAAGLMTVQLQYEYLCASVTRGRAGALIIDECDAQV